MPRSLKKGASLRKLPMRVQEIVRRRPPNLSNRRLRELVKADLSNIEKFPDAELLRLHEQIQSDLHNGRQAWLRAEEEAKLHASGSDAHKCLLNFYRYHRTRNELLKPVFENLSAELRRRTKK